MHLARLAFSTLTLFCIGATALGANSGAGFEPLFIGNNLEQWMAVGCPESSWRVEGNLLVCTGEGAGWLATRKTYQDFEIMLEFRVPPGGNSGLFLRAPLEGNPTKEGLEVQILDDKAPQYSDLEPWQYCASVYGTLAAQRGVSRKPGAWQQLHARLVGRQITVTLNGQLVLGANLDDHVQSEVGHPGLKRARGHIGLQNHGTEVAFRNILIRDLSPVSED